MTGPDLVLPAIIRGEIVDTDLVSFDGRGGTASFQTPDPRSLIKRLPLPTPHDLADIQELPFEEIVDCLDALSRRLALADNVYLQEALQHSVAWSDMTPPLVESAFEQIEGIFRGPAVREVAAMTVGIPYLSGWVPQTLSDGRRASIRAVGARAVHIVAGNSPMVSALTIVRNAITRSDAIIKTPSNDPLTALAIARTLAELAPGHPLTRHLTVAYWKGGDTAFEEQLYRPEVVEKIVAWGGLASITHVGRYLAPGLELVTLDPKRSATIIGAQAFDSEQTLRDVAVRAATDVGALNQLGCVNARVLYVQSGTDPEGLQRAGRLGQLIYDEMQQLPSTISTPAKRFDPQLREAIDAVRTSPEWYQVIGGRDGEGAVIISQLDEPVEFHRSLSCRVANIVPIDDLRTAIEATNAYTQTIGIYPDSLKAQVRDDLARHGAQRLVSLGYAAHNHTGLPQDAIEPVRRMVKWIVDESCDESETTPLWRSPERAGHSQAVG